MSAVSIITSIVLGFAGGVFGALITRMAIERDTRRRQEAPTPGPLP